LATVAFLCFFFAFHQLASALQVPDTLTRRAQEVDIGCERSAWADCGDAIARALGMSYAFVAEFTEEHSPLRTPETQGGGVHGQAILSRYPLCDVRAVVHSHQPVDWDAEGCVPAALWKQAVALTSWRAQGGTEGAAAGQARRARCCGGAAAAAGARAGLQLASGGVHRHHGPAHAVCWCAPASELESMNPQR
jgi:hypothetical protein